MKWNRAGVRAIMGVAALAGVLVGGFGRASETRAAVASRGDPIFWIAGASGGVAANYGVQIGVSVSTNSKRVVGINYALHGPVGTAVRWSFITDDNLAAVESYTYTADRTDQQVVTVTTVTTAGGSVPVTVSEAAIQISSLLSGTPPFQVSGLSNQGITSVVGG